MPADGHLPWAEAHAVAWSAAGALGRTSRGLDAALGSVLATDLRAVVPLPAFDTAAMDGFAVAGDGPWTVVGQVLAGDPPPADIADGQCLEVATGAPVPPTTRAVLPYEQATRTDGVVAGPAAPEGRHVRPRGQDCPQGERLVPAGRQVTPAVLGLAASVGCDVLDVVRPPEVTVLVTGDEVVAHGAPAAGQVRDAIGPTLPGVVAAAGGAVCELRRLADEQQGLDDALEQASGDVLVVSGGSAAGPADHLRTLLRKRAATVLVSAVACRPGHPQLLATLPDGRWVVGLPGNPYAALGAMVTLLVPLLTTLAGRPRPRPRFGRLSAVVSPHAHDTRLVAVREADDGYEHLGHDRSGNLWGAALADALAVVPPGQASTWVQLLQLPTGAQADSGWSSAPERLVHAVG